MNYNQFFVGSLTILFVALKLTNVIAWPWWWVMSPIWIAALLGIGISLLYLAVKLNSRKGER